MEPEPVVAAAGMGRFFDLNPCPTFIVDEDVTLLRFNPAAERLLGRTPGQVMAQVRHRAGEVLACVNASKTPQGCGGAAECRSCVVRNSVAGARGERAVSRRLAHLQLARDEGVTDFYGYASVTPFEHEGRTLFLLILEDVTDLMRMGQLVSMCAWCRKVRLEDRFWATVEDMLRTRLHMQVSHGICEACLDENYPDVDEGR